MSDPIRICRVCSVEHQIQRRKGDYTMGFCPICEEYHALFEVVEGQPNPIGDSCGNCHLPWPCGCIDPVWICGVCGNDQYDCRCSEGLEFPVYTDAQGREHAEY